VEGFDLPALAIPADLFQSIAARGFQPLVLLLSAIERLFGDADLPDYSATGTRTSTCLNTPTICSTEKRLLFMANPLPQVVDFAGN
jgi:hypothetical protein